MVELIIAVVCLLTGFVGGVLVGRKNRAKVEQAVALAKDPTSVLK